MPSERTLIDCPACDGAGEFTDKGRDWWQVTVTRCHRCRGAGRIYVPVEAAHPDGGCACAASEQARQRFDVIADALTTPADDEESEAA